MLSRVQRLEDLIILRSFNESTLNMKLSPALVTEFNRQYACAKKTDTQTMAITYHFATPIPFFFYLPILYPMNKPLSNICLRHKNTVI